MSSNNNSTKLSCYRFVSDKRDTCTVGPGTDIHATPPKCVVVEDYETEKAFNERKPDRLQQGCVGGDTPDSSDYHCAGPSQIIRYYNQKKYVEYTYCCSSNYCNNNTEGVMSNIFPLSSQLNTADPTQAIPWGTSIIQLILPSVIIPLVCTGVCISLFVAVCVSVRGKHRYKGSVRSSQHPFFDNHTRLSGTIDTDVYPLSTMTYGDGTVSSSATGIPLLEQRTISGHISLQRILGQGRYGSVYEGEPLVLIRTSFNGSLVCRI